MSDAKAIVEQAYDSLADWYLTWINDQPSPRERYARKVLENATSSNTTTSTTPTTTTTTPTTTTTTPNPQPYILELGCGPGIPITRLLLSLGAKVLANDISHAQIALAKSHCLHIPANTTTTNTTTNKNIHFIPSDMTLLTLPPSTLDGAICLFTLFHLPRGEQKPMLAKIHSWLKPGALLAVNFATVDDEAIWGEMMGRGIFWSSFGEEGNRAMAVGVGFEVEGEEVLASEADGGVEFQWMALRKRGEEEEDGVGGSGGGVEV